MKWQKTYCFLLADDSIFIRAGSFSGTEQEFLEEISKIYNGSFTEKFYKLALEAIKLEFLEK